MVNEKNILKKEFQFVSYPKPTHIVRRKGFCKHGFPYFQSCDKCGRDMIKRTMGKHLKLLKKTAPKRSVKSKSRKHLPSIKKIKKQAWDAFAKFIRNRDKKCLLCGSVKGLSAGHLIPIGKAPTRYDENNVFGICSTCNFRDRFERGYHDYFVSWYLITYGAGRYLKLVEKSRGDIQYKRYDYEKLIKKYESK